MCNDIFSHDMVIVSIPYFDVRDIMNGPQCEQDMCTLLRYPISSLVFTKVHVFVSCFKYMFDVLINMVFLYYYFYMIKKIVLFN